MSIVKSTFVGAILVFAQLTREVDIAVVAAPTVRKEINCFLFIVLIRLMIYN